MPAEKVTANQALFNATVRHQVHVLRFAENQAQLAATVLKEAEQELLEKITGAMAKGLDTSRLEALLVSVKDRRELVYSQLADQMEETLKDFSEAEAAWEVGALEGSAPVALLTASVPLEQLHATVASPIAGIPLRGWTESVSRAEMAALQQAVTQAVLQGQTIDDLVRRIRGSKANDFKDGILSTSTRNAQALARTAVNHVSNEARNCVWEANSDIIRALRWTSTLDGRTSDLCKSRDGHVTPIGTSALLPSDQPLIPAGARPPGHLSCRSLLVAILDGVELAGDRPFIKDARVRKDREAAFRKEAKERGVPIQQVRKEWADANVGQVPAATTYGEWLKSQPNQFQDEVLGRGKAEMFRSGIPLERFVDKSGKTLTLAELKAELAGDSLNVLQPAIGLKAKGLLMQGLAPDEVLKAIKSEFPSASTSVASIASYKSELKKAGLLMDQVPSFAQKSLSYNTPYQVSAFESKLTPGVKNALQGQWASVVDSLEGHPGAYAHYKPGIGVELSDAKMSGLSLAQSHQIMAHELGHLLHKVHDVVPDNGNGSLLSIMLEDMQANMAPELKKMYSYYSTNADELWAEVLGQALHDSPVTSQGIAAEPFKEFFAPWIVDAKKLLTDKFPEAPPVMPTGPVVSGIGEIAGKPTSIGGYAKALIQQGMPDDAVLIAVKAEFPNAKTGLNSIKSYKSELKKAELQAIGKTGPTIQAKASADIPTVTPVPAAAPKPTAFADPAAELPKPTSEVMPLSGFTKTGGKPGGSNPGALYADITGNEWLVKGNLQKVNGSVSAEVSDARAMNEVLTARLIRYADEGLAPEMKLVDLEGQFGGGLGVVSRMLDTPIVKFNVSNAAHVAAAQKDFALHAWLGNWDAVGASFDNLVMKGGKAVNIDPGGALLFRAQGLPKNVGDFDVSASDWESMRSSAKNANAAKVYGSMTEAQLQASAQQLMKFTDEVIDEMVKAMNPGALLGKDNLAELLKGRRDAILKKAGLKMPPKVKQAPAFMDTMPTGASTGLPDFGPNKAVIDNLINSEANYSVGTIQYTLEELGFKLTDEQVTGYMALVKNAKGKEPFLASALPPQYLSILDSLVEQQPGKAAFLTDSKIAAMLNKEIGDADGLVQVSEVSDYIAWKTGKAPQTWPEIFPGSLAEAPAVNYKQMTSKELMDALVPADLEIKAWTGKTAASWKIQQAAAPLFKSGISTDKVHEVLVMKFGPTYVPKTTSLASMKSKLKKQGLLDGPATEVKKPGAMSLPEPKLWATQLGNKSATVKEGAKNMVQQGTDAGKVVEWIGLQFSKPNPQGAQDLYELAHYEVMTGKAQKSGVSAVQEWANAPKPSMAAPVPLRPATKVGEAGPPPPRFTKEGWRAGLQKYGGLGEATENNAGLLKINKAQKAAGLPLLEPEEYAAIKAYTGSAYSRVNALLREGEFANDTYLQAWTDAAMQGMYKLPAWSGDVVRGMTVNASTVTQLKQFYKVGAVVSENQFTSTSAVVRGGKGFGGNVRYHIKTASGRDVKPISSFKGEEEILLVPGTKYKVLKVEPYSGGYGADGFSVYMEEV